MQGEVHRQDLEFEDHEPDSTKHILANQAIGQVKIAGDVSSETQTSTAVDSGSPRGLLDKWGALDKISTGNPELNKRIAARLRQLHNPPYLYNQAIADQLAQIRNRLGD
jgi:hypothetical protein